MPSPSELDASEPTPSMQYPQSHTLTHTSPCVPYLCLFVGIECEISAFLLVRSGFELSEVSVIVAFHLQIEHLGFSIDGCWDQILIQQPKNIVANVCQLLLNLSTTQTNNHVLSDTLTLRRLYSCECGQRVLHSLCFLLCVRCSRQFSTRRDASR